MNHGTCQIARSSSNLRVMRILANELDRVISRMCSSGRRSTCARVTIEARRGGAGGQVWKVLTTVGGPKTAVHYSPNGLIDIGTPNNMSVEQIYS